MSALQVAVSAVVEGRDLSRAEARDAMREIMSGQAPEPLIGAYLVALRMKGETVDEIAGSAETMRELVHRIETPEGDVVDTCGTGGDGLHTLNVSTGAALVAAAAGAVVAKHGNRAVSSRSGSADVLEHLGVNVSASPETVAACIREVGVGFLFAPSLHPAIKHAMPSRRALGIRTVFNLLGPMTNPAGANRQLIGVFARRWVPRVAEVLGALGCDRALVAHGEDGMDEITLTAPTHLAEWREGAVHEWTFRPEDAGLARCRPEDIAGGTPEENAAQLGAILRGETGGPPRDIVLLNAGAVLHVAGRAESIADGVEAARGAVDGGAAWDTLNALARRSRA